jgi:hypothetical protein
MKVVFQDDPTTNPQNSKQETKTHVADGMPTHDAERGVASQFKDLMSQGNEKTRTNETKA